jgi:hypothetical protein
MNRTELQINLQIKSTIEGAKNRVSPFQARAIAVAAMEENGGQVEVDVDFCMIQPRTKLGTASSRVEGGVRWITLYEGGQVVGTLLHEIAHQMPDGMNHDGRWQRNFRKVAAWWNENSCRFPYNFGMQARPQTRSAYALQY